MNKLNTPVLLNTWKFNTKLISNIRWRIISAQSRIAGIKCLNPTVKSWDSVVSIATDYGLVDRGVGVLFPVGSGILSTSSRPALGSTQPPMEWVTEALSPKVKRPGHEANHLPPASAEVRNCRCIHPLPLTPSWRSA
jgi:hypothetical protein